jgi:glycogen operon protein
VDPIDSQAAGGVALDASAAPVAAATAGEALGFERRGAGGRFAVHAAATREVAVDLFLPGAARPFESVSLTADPAAAAPFRIWRAEASRLPHRFEYLLRVDGGAPLVDPYARQLAGGETWGRSDDALAPGVGRRYRGLVDERPFDWEGVERPRVADGERVIYELHVRGFTRHASAGVAHPGGYLGVVEKIDYLRELGVTTVELMPVAEFDETENPRRNPRSGERLLNFWGYSPVSFFAPKAAYASAPEPGRAALELREMVRELHRAGLEVIVDVVLNHTAEGAGGATDPTHSWRGLDPAAYYLLDPASGAPLDFTGCGNTVNVNHPVTRRLIVDALRHWCDFYRVDSFRFDLAAVFFRGERGETLARSPLVEAIAADPVLRERLLIAEPWDARGFSPPGGFPAPWREWDGEFRDGLRRWVAGFERDPRPLARRLAGLGPQGGAVPAARAVRFAACHDGRTLADVVAYAAKRNLDNGEENHDGWGGEVAWNGGVEGPAADPALQAVRARELRALVALLAAAPGTLQLTAGDERLRSQRGNNNAWCQDNEIGWVDWTVQAEGEQFRTFLRRLLRLRRDWLREPEARRAALVEPFTEPGERGLIGPGSAFLLLAANARLEPLWCVAANSGAAAVRFPMPGSPSGGRWRLRLDTARPAGHEIFFGDEAPFLAFETTHLAVQPRAVRILTAEPLPLRPE